MKIILFLLILSASTLASGDTVKKWTDEKGKIHYGNMDTAKDAKKVETLKIEDTFDQKSYEEGLQRQKETEAFVKEYEDEREKQEKAKPDEDVEPEETAGELDPGSQLAPGAEDAPGAESAPGADYATGSTPAPGSKLSPSFKTAPGSQPIPPEPRPPVVKPIPAEMSE